MKLKRLEIVGFKSFADPFVMDFQKGISALVGPNGCGKSNVADALRWVLGTQSARQIRADVMEDVIFKGSSRRKPLGMAEVTVTFDNDDRSLPLDFDEVSVTRRLFRSGASEYQINGNRCRLMDVTDLIVDRGLGSAGYWILEAEMVKTILSPRAEDRRELFDEAAGIGRYKIQRHRASLKLETAGSDLDRLSDIISEVERNHGVLRKQVSAYRRHERAETAIRQIRAAMASGELRLLETRLAEARAELKESGELEASQAAALASLETSLSEARIRLSEAQSRLDEANSRRASLDGEIASLERDRAVAVERVAGMRRTALENQARCARERERIQRYERDARQAEAEAGEWEKARLEAETLESEAARAAEAEAANIEIARDRLKQIENREKQCGETLADLRNRYLETLRTFETARQRAGELTRRLGENREETAGLSRELQGINRELEQVSREREKATGEIKTAFDALDSARRHESEAALKAGEARAFLAACRRETEGLAQALDEARRGDSLGAALEPTEGMGPAVGACLDGFQPSLPVERVSADLPARGARYAVGGRPGVADIPEDAVRMDGFLKISHPVAESVLRHYILAPDMDTALKWFGANIPMGIVTVEGHLFNRDGTVRLGVPPDGAGALEIASALEEAREREAQLRDEIHRLDEDRQSSEKALEGLREQAEKLRAGLSGLESREAVLVSGRNGVEKTLQGLKAASEAMEKELAEIAFSGGDQETPDPDHRIRETEEALAALSLESRMASQALDELRERSAGVFMARERAGLQLREAVGRVAQIQARLAELSAEADSAASAEEEMRVESETLLRKADETEKGIALILERVKVLEKERAGAEENRGKAAEIRAGLLQQTSSLEEQTVSARTLHGIARDRKSKAASEASALEERVARLRLEAPGTDDENPFLGSDARTLEEEEARQQRVIEGIGPVNMLAEEEFREAEERLRFLTDQKRDLQEARESLETAITEINREAQTRFRETFAQVREHFRQVFVELFGGGEADITALDAEDPLEGGVQIVARPQGKKLENVTALSGGERALAAVALLFSLYLVKPSPFCILDELDAPLDDANIDSFMGILRRFSADTQFIIMTHNKRTMQASDRLYGVTMAEKGVSSLTTVSLSDYD